MKAKDLMTRGASTCRANDDLTEAAKIMWEHDCGVVPVTDESGHLTGVVTDRDVCMSAYTQGRSLSDLKVSDAMSRSIQCCREDEEVSDVEATLGTHPVRRLPVVDDMNRVVGVLSLNDLAVHALRAGDEEEKLAVATTLGRISRPREGIPFPEGFPS
jgi:CBS domain-containing protein